MLLETASRWICSITFPRTQVLLNQPVAPQMLLLARPEAGCKICQEVPSIVLTFQRRELVALQ